MKPLAVQKKFLGSVKIFWLNKKEIWEELQKRIMKMVKDKPFIKAIYLFGSFKEGKAVVGSDIDLLILVKQSDERIIDRPLSFYSYFEGLGIGVDIFCYTLEEANTIPFVKMVLEKGKCLYNNKVLSHDLL